MTTLRYDVTCQTPGDQPVRIVLRFASPQQARHAIYTALALRYGEGTIYDDGWRFVHERSPHVAGKPWPWPPTADRVLRGPVDATISLIVVQPPRTLPPPVDRADIDDWLVTPPAPRVSRSQLVLAVLLLLVIVRLIAELEGGAP